jgi:hypothetical protein
MLLQDYNVGYPKLHKNLREILIIRRKCLKRHWLHMKTLFQNFKKTWKQD